MIVILICEVKLFIDTFPRLMEVLCLVFFDIVVVIGLFDVISSFLSDDFMSLVIEHSFLGYSLDTVAIFVGLLFLRYGFSILVFSSCVFVVTLSVHFSIRTHYGTTHKCLTDIRSILCSSMSLLMHYLDKSITVRKSHHPFHGVSKWSHYEIIFNEVVIEETHPSKTSKTSHYLVHLSEWIMTSKYVQLIRTETSINQTLLIVSVRMELTSSSWHLFMI